MRKIVPPFLRTPYNYDTNQAGDDSGLKCLDKTLTQQQFREEADINTIVERFNLTGELPTDVRMPMNGDFTNTFDFQTAMNTLVAARESFDAMPAKIRARFHNNAAEFVDFCSDPENRPEALRMGLVEKPLEDVLAPPGQKAPEAPTPPETPPKGGKTDT